MTGEAETFLRALHGNCEGRTELRIFSAEGGPPRTSFYDTPDDAAAHIDTLAFWRTRSNIYVGIATRDDSGRGRRDNCVAAPGLWVDIDWKTASEKRSKLRKLGKVAEPSFIVNSGNGLHCYWIFEKPLDAREHADAIEASLRGLCDAIGGDPKATDLPRILRVPGTTNYPNAKKRAAGRTEQPVLIQKGLGR